MSKLIRSDFVLTDEYATIHATLEDALSHRTGLPRHDLTWAGRNTSVQSIVDKLRFLPMTEEIRTRWQYCNVMYITISHFIENWTGMWLGDFLRKRIYGPLNMTSTFFSLSDAQAGKAPLATPYWWSNSTRKYNAIAYANHSQMSGAGATVSNVLDYAKWIRCMMTSSPPLSPAGHAAVHFPRIASSMSPTDPATGFRELDQYALGWDTSNYRGEVMHWHSGGVPGFATIMLYFPRLKWGLNMMTNGGEGETILSLTFEMLDDKLGVPEEDRYDWDQASEKRHLQGLEMLKHAEELLYPSAPKAKDAIPLPLPLDAYAGVRSLSNVQC